MGKASAKSDKANLPQILLTNLMSYGKTGETDKTCELESVLEQNKVEVGIFTETWATENTLGSLDFGNYNMFHSVRKKCKSASGGLSIFVRDYIPATKLNVDVPSNLEVIYVSIRPKRLPRQVSNIVICGVYYPGINSIYAPPQEDLIMHLTETIQGFYIKYSNPLIMLLGDFNDLNILDICDACSLKQVVKVPTRKNAILDLIMTNIDNTLYEDPISLPSISTSDHLCILYVPKNHIKEVVIKKKIKIREYKKSAILEFGAWLVNFEWSYLFEIDDVDLKVEYFCAITWLMIDKFFPVKQVTISSSDKEWITPRIKCLIKQRQKAHMANNFDLRNHLARKIRSEIRKAKIQYNKNKTNLFHLSNSREWYSHINKIIGNKKNKVNFINISDIASKPINEQIKIVNSHFAKICTKYPPLDKNVKLIETKGEEGLNYVTEFWTYNMILKYAKKSLGPNDFPKRILKEFAPELATPFSNIINCSLKTGFFPAAYKKAEIVPIPKINPPHSLSDLRPISKTPIGGKMIEKALMFELEKDIKGKLDSNQFGNCKGSSTTHYLIKLTDQAYRSTDVGHATTAITIDYSKAFDYVNHNVLIEKLVQLGIRGRVINLIISFLSDRSHSTNFQGVISEFEKITCGVPQGTVMGPKLFIILINGDKCSFVQNFKFVDDKTLVLSYTGDPTETLQKALDIELIETEKDKMIINESKCHNITFNFSQKNIPPQNVKLNNKIVNPASKIKLLGVTITDDLKWTKNTTEICSKVNRKLYIISKLKHFGLQSEELLTAWVSILRPITEYAAPLWHSGLTECDVSRIEMLQKKVLAIILGTVYVNNKRRYKINNKLYSYNNALQLLGLTTLKNRREVLTNKFALDALQSEAHSSMFVKNDCNYMNTRNRLVLKAPNCKTDRYFNSAIPYMTRLLNNVYLKGKIT